MKKISSTNKWAGRAGIVLAVVILASVISARGEPNESSILKPYPMAKCVVDGKKLSKFGSPYAVSWQSQEVKLCCEKCLPEFQKHSARYISKINRAEKRAARVKAAPSVAPASDNQPGGLAWSGW